MSSRIVSFAYLNTNELDRLIELIDADPKVFDLFDFDGDEELVDAPSGCTCELGWIGATSDDVMKSFLEKIKESGIEFIEFDVEFS